MINNEINGCDCSAQVLVVDDNELNILALKMTIETHFDAKVIEADNGLKALEIFRRGLAKECGCKNRVPVLVFMDIQMPIMDGIKATQEILKAVAESQDPPQLKIVALTAYQGNEVKADCVRVGLKEVYNKPMAFE